MSRLSKLFTKKQEKPIPTSSSTANGEAKPAATLPFVLGEHAIDEARPMKVIVIGAGYSGILAGIRFSQRVKNLNLTIYDANSGVGGTWFVNKYPGVACDVPAHSYQYTFEANKNWSSYYSPGSEILKYLQGVAEKYNLIPIIKLQHRIVRAQYNEATGKWLLRIRRPTAAMRQLITAENLLNGDIDYEEFEDTADVLFTGFGGLNRWKWPQIDGFDTFKGPIIHSARWETGEGDSSKSWESTTESWKDKTVGVIGVGSSAIQIVPAIQPRVAKLVTYVRGKTWISVPFVGQKLEQLSGDPNRNYQFTEQDKALFRDDEYYKKFRWEAENELNSVHPATLLGSEMSVDGQKVFKEVMENKLAKRPWIAEKIIPDFPVACRRLTPGPGYLEAICEGNVEFISSPIEKITPTGTQTKDGSKQDLDIIICATGFDTSFKPEFPFIGRGGVDLRDKWTPYPRTYISLAVDGFPNWFSALGPNSAIGAGQLLIIIEKQVDYAVQATLKIQRERLKSMEAKKEAVDDFDEYIETVFGQKCKSWYKMGKEEGRVAALWPSSSLHAARTFENPRWEDYNYEYLDGVKNRFNFLGDGMTINEKTKGGDLAWYLKEIDHPPPRQDSPAHYDDQ